MLFKLLGSLFLAIFFFNSSVLYSQNKTLHFNISATRIDSISGVKIFGFYGSDMFAIDSFPLFDKKNEFNLKNDQLYKGFYRIQFSKDLFYDFIGIPGDSLNFHFNPDNFKNELVLESNSDNSILHQLKREVHEVNNTINLIRNIQSEDTFIQNNSARTILELKMKKNELIHSYRNKFSHPVYAGLSDFIKEPIDENGNESGKIFLNNLHLSDSFSIRTNLLPQKLIDYLAFYKNPDEESFKEGIREVFAACGNNEITRKYCLFFYLNLFNKVGPEPVFRFLVEEYYLNEACHEEDEKLLSEVNQNVHRLMKLLPGNKIENLILTDFREKPVNLYEQTRKYDKTILVFWSPDCHYCEELIIQLKKNYKKFKKKKIQIISFSITTDKNEWLDKSKEFQWINTSDLKAWGSATVKNLAVNKTPMMIMIDSQNKILKYDFYIEDIDK